MRLWTFTAGFFLFAAFGCAHKPVEPFQLRGVWHPVSSGDTVSSVAERYGATAVIVAELNDLPVNGFLRGRKEVFVPKSQGKPVGTGAPPNRRSPVGRASVQSASNSASRGRCGEGGRPCLAWPVAGRVSSGFGKRSSGHHDGIDIPAKRGTPVRSVADGQVLYSGDEIKGYGNLIIIRHENDIITVYANNEKNMIKEGDKVTRGQLVAKVGNSGSSTGVHLHFEVRTKEQPQNPLLYLTPQQK